MAFCRSRPWNGLGPKRFILLNLHCRTPCHQTWSWTFDSQQCCYRADCHSSFAVERVEAWKGDELLRGVASDEAEARGSDL